MKNMTGSAPLSARRRSGRLGIALGLGLLIAAMLLVLTLAERGLFRRPAPASSPTALPGLTIEDTGSTPVVTSLRSGSEAEQRGIEVGDDVLAVDGRPVASVAALRAAVVAGPAGPLALHIQRGNAIWDVALDRAETDAEPGPATGDGGNGTENPAG